MICTNCDATPCRCVVIEHNCNLTDLMDEAIAEIFKEEYDKRDQ